MNAAWWSVETGAYIGAGAGVLAGLLGTIIGVMAGVLVPKGRGGRLLLVMFIGTVALGIVLLGAGIAALAMQQPRHVWYPLLLVGGILTFVFGMQLIWLPRMLRAIEARRVAAADFRRS